MHTTLTNQDLQFVVRRIPRDVRDMMIAGPFFIGGGFIRETIAGGDVKDIDIFGPTKGKLIDAADAFSLNRGVKPHETDNAITVLCPPRLPVQFITRWVFEEAAALVASFDFTVCQAAIWFDKTTQTWRSEVGVGFYPDLAARRLVYTLPQREEEAGGSMMRVRKFLARGYNIQATSLGAVIARVVSKVKDFNSMSEEHRGVVIAGLLHEVDPLLVVDGLEPINEHQIIN
jgi:hypothetical protein